VRELLGSEPRDLERRKVIDDEVKSRVSANRVDEVESSDEDTSSVWLMVRSSIKEHDHKPLLLDLAPLDLKVSARAPAVEPDSPTCLKSPVILTFDDASETSTTGSGPSENFGTLV